MSQIDSPLDLTVHQLPSPSADASRTAVGRWKMLLVLFICALPVVASYFTYYVLKPSNHKSFGELIEPQRPMPDLWATEPDGASRPLRSLYHQWLLISVAGGACDQACEAHLYMQRQLRETLGKDKDRLDWVWLISDEAPLNARLQEHLLDPKMQAQGLHVLRVKQAQLLAWLQPSSTHATDKRTTTPLSAHLYLVDPQGNYMMRFPENMGIEQAAKAKADISRLLRASSFWDTGGRPQSLRARPAAQPQPQAQGQTPNPSNHQERSP